jgi:CRISPR system Cascade subunit CasD
MMGVRVDREGLLKLDYQTAGGRHRRGEIYGVAKASGGTPDTVQSNRYYLADASFLVGLEGRESLLRELDGALAAPVWQLFLGRKSYVPGEPVRLPEAPPEGPGVRDLPLEEALRSYPWPTGYPGPERDGPERLRLLLEATGVEVEVRRDVPLSFEMRQFAMRTVRTIWMDRSAKG